MFHTNKVKPQSDKITELSQNHNLLSEQLGQCQLQIHKDLDTPNPKKAISSLGLSLSNE